MRNTAPATAARRARSEAIRDALRREKTLGLVPDRQLAALYRCRMQTVADVRRERGIAPLPPGRQSTDLDTAEEQRRRILLALRALGPVAAEALATVTHLSTGTVHRHLVAMALKQSAFIAQDGTPTTPALWMST